MVHIAFARAVSKVEVMVKLAWLFKTETLSVDDIPSFVFVVAVLHLISA